MVIRDWMSPYGLTLMPTCDVFDLEKICQHFMFLLDLSCFCVTVLEVL
jgi:hypothetical protein